MDAGQYQFVLDRFGLGSQANIPLPVSFGTDTEVFEFLRQRLPCFRGVGVFISGTRCYLQNLEVDRK